MLSQQAVLERAMRALDELVGKQASEGVPVAGETTPEPESNPEPQRSLKGHAVELWRDGSRFFLVADEEDAREAIRRFGARRGEVWIPAEIELVARIADQTIRNELAAFKHQLDGCLNETGPQGITWAEWKAAELNQLFKEQGKPGQAGRIAASTVRDGERKARGT